MVKGILCSYTKYGRVSTWLLRPPHHHRHPIPFTLPQTHCASPLTELLNWLSVKNKSIPLLSSSRIFFSPCFFPFFPLTSLTRTLCRLSPALGVWFFLVWEERPQDEIAHGVIALINMFHSLSEGPPSSRPLSCTSFSSFFFLPTFLYAFFWRPCLFVLCQKKTLFEKALIVGPICLQKLINTCPPTYIHTHTHTYKYTLTHSLTHSWARGSQGPWLCGVLWSEILMQRFKAHTNPL